MKNHLSKLLILLTVVTLISCDKEELFNFPQELQGEHNLGLEDLDMYNLNGETAYSDGGTGEIIGYSEGCPSYGIYEYTLFAGKTNDAGTVIITNDDEFLYVTYNTNGTADLGEAHVYVWTDPNDIPTKRPSPGHAPYKAEDINADSYTFNIPLSDFVISDLCGYTFYVSTHAALVADGTDGDDEDDGTDESNEGETAYAGGSNTPGGYESNKGAWWGYVTYEVECYFSIEGTVYNDADESYDMESGESTFEGITVNLLDSNGNVIATTLTAADGSYIFEGLEGGLDYTVVVADEMATYTATENAGGYTVINLNDCVTEVDFGYYEDGGDDPNNDFEETAYMFGNWSFCDYQPRWGWANYIEPGQVITELIYAGAGQCNTDNGTVVGSATIDYSTSGSITISISYEPGYTMNNIHINIDDEDPTTITPNMNSNGNFNNNPTGVVYPLNSFTETYSFDGPAYVIIHMEAIND